MVLRFLRGRLGSRLWLLIGLALILAYWVSVKPAGSPPGYSEDMCNADEVRQLMGENLKEYGGPHFSTDHVMAPYGTSAPYMSWTIEQDWIGGYVWNWDRTFPYLWVYFGVSLVVAFLVCGSLMEKLGLSPRAAWFLATVVTLVHVPRHFKIWHHYEHLPEHWLYISLFIDAVVWQKIWRDRTWSLKWEAWRGVAMLGTLGTAGYFWGPMVLEWMVLRICGAVTVLLSRRAGTSRPPIRFDLAVKPLALPMAILAAQVGLEVRWFSALAEEVRKFGEIWQPMAWFADLPSILRPLWWERLDSLLSHVSPALNLPLRPIDWSETVVSVGWLYWVPTLLGVGLLIRKRALGRVLPFLIFLVIGCLYVRQWNYFPLQPAIQAVIPFMKFFRVASRWGLILPQTLAVIVALSWPELVAWFREPKAWRHWHRWATYIAIPFFLAEALWLLYPVNALPKMPEHAEQMLAKIHDLPGTTVLDMPFCVAGGNGYCTAEQCPNYPYSTTGACLREWHEKKVFGLYAGRMTPAHCQIYDRAPYLSWFDAWRQQRCLSDAEWTQFCSYLDEHPEFSAVLIYPDIWYGARTRQCMEAIESHLGAPIDQASYRVSPTRGGEGANPTRVLWYAPKCRAVTPPTQGGSPNLAPGP